MKPYGMTTDLRIAVLEKLVAGWPLEETYRETARKRGIDFRVMREVAEGYGYPERHEMTSALEALRATYAAEHPPEPKKAKAQTVEPASYGRTGTYANPTEVPAHLAEPPRPAVEATGAPVNPLQAGVTVEPTPPASASLITRAGRSTSAKVRRAGERAQAALDLVRDLLTEDEEHALARAEVERLRAELRAAEAALRPPRSKHAGAGSGRPIDYDTRTVRAWADENGVQCPRAGRYLPADVVAAWRTATQPEAQEATPS